MTLNEIKQNIQIIDFARELGFTVKKIGSFYTLKEHDSVRIDPRKNLFIQNSTAKGGSIIDFAETFAGMTTSEAIRYFAEQNPTPVKRTSNQVGHTQEKKTFKLPAKDGTMKNVFAYLINTRGIDADIVQSMVHRKMLYQDEHKNCVFVSYKNDQAVFACKRGTNTYKTFVADVAGSDYEHMFFLDNNAAELIVTESVIDALSVMSFKKEQGKSIESYNYLALAGVGKWERAIDYHTKNISYERIYLALDNDDAGHRTAESITRHLCGKNIEIINDFPEAKDWNEQLQLKWQNL